MQRSSFPWIWLAVAAILLLVPGTAGRIVLEVLGGLTLLLILLPLLAVGVGFLGWQLIRHNLKTCAVCGATSFGSSVCPACGAGLTHPTSSPWQNKESELEDAAKATINVEAVDVDPNADADAKTSF